MSIMKTRWLIVMIVTTLVSGTVYSAASAPVAVDTSREQDNRHWITVYTNQVPLCWEWIPTAEKARLAIVGMNQSVEKEFTPATSSWVWQVFDSDVPTSEDLFDLTLTFYDGGESVVGVMTSRLAVVRGAFGGISVDPSPEKDGKWSKVTANSLLPFDAGWSAATMPASSSQLVIAKDDGLTQTNLLPDASGYFGWKVLRSDWGYGTFNLALSFPETGTNVWQATLTRVTEGLILRLQ